ncbi:hypothetical protein BDK51DRAFT_21951 [Blyttiomyces helicus]|uniref:Cilia- and flagella-associated protein 43 n=1 Tax=Blyttiomyces helicus TaxID=388810 RepID=A0A4P9WNF9_9FUNG|nr:hypothetical protein BDK51DRAFT_21951 [Blyttiomyces helicus]|eukprot:RKO94661.1 hypothetical protein BDK51DRAFT_21951 [Blyttiomyces helicus]
MPASLYGELEIKKSIGHTPICRPAFVNPTTIVYASGNLLNFIDVAPGTENDDRRRATSAADAEHDRGNADGPSAGASYFTAESQITAFAVYTRESIIAFAQRNSPQVSLVRWPGGVKLTEASDKMTGRSEGDIAAIAFSWDGHYLATLGGTPSFYIRVWDWRSGSLLCENSNECQATSISFNPLHSKQLCTSGEAGLIKFWKLELGYRTHSLKSIIGDQNIPTPAQSELVRPTSVLSAFFDTAEQVPPHVRPVHHVWKPDGHVLCATDSGDELIEFDPESGACYTAFLSREREPVETDPMLNIGGPGNMRCVLISKYHMIVAGQDGVVRWINQEARDVSKSVKVAGGSSIRALVPSLDYRNIIVECEDGRIFTYHYSTETVVLVIDGPCSDVTSMAAFRLQNFAVTAGTKGVLQFFDMESTRMARRFSVPGAISSVAASLFSGLMAVGSELGVVRLYYTPSIEEADLKLLFREKLHASGVKHVTFDPSGRYLATASEDGRVYLCEVLEEFQVLGYLHFEESIKAIAWKVEEADEEDVSVLLLYVLAVEKNQCFSNVHRFQVPLLPPIERGGADGYMISRQLLRPLTYRIDDILSDLVLTPSHLSAGREAFYVMSKDRKLKMYTAPAPSKLNPEENTQQFEALHITFPTTEYLDHQKAGGHVLLTIDCEWILTYAPDGSITVRTFMEPEKSVTLRAHEPSLGGVRAMAIGRDCKRIMSVGADGLMRFWDWKYSATGKRVAQDVSTLIENLLEGEVEMLSDIRENLSERQALENDKADSQEETRLFDLSIREAHKQSEAEREREAFQSSLEAKLSGIRDRLTKAMEKNEILPEIERIDREEFVVDFDERSRLLSEADATIRKVRMGIEEENMKKRVIRNRIKRECWDSMEVIGQSIKSFHLDTVTSRLTEVTNYPLRNRTSKELEKVNRVILLRRIQLQVTAATKKGPREMDLEDHDLGDSAIAPSEELTWQDVAQMKNRALIYDAFELTNNERKRTQIVLLGEVIIDTKAEFNEKFKDFVRQKQEEIAKIEEKNDRINIILAELQIQENVFHPELDNDEVPDRIINASEEEITAEKLISPEEQRRLDEKRLQDQERARLQAEDNFRERALMQMMGGKLEERTEQEDKEDLVRPDWMSKPKEELNDEERKLIKEFEKKVAVLKEEQEKYRKALETELRKLQGLIIEICDGFDANLRDFFKFRLDTDQAIYQTELKIIKLCQSTLYSEDDELKEASILSRLEELRFERLNCLAEIPEIKKDVEQFKEENDQASRREKEIERQFRKEFHGYEAYFDTLLRLFKRRELVVDLDTLTATQDENLSPFAAHDKTLSAPEDTPPPLSMEADCPEGLGGELWAKLVELRDRKIAAEQEERATRKRSEEIKELGEGVEVFQAPVVTDYSDAVLLHRSVVEKLNESIIALGQAKVEALKEMKDYRKGIHALEWENRMLDFQAEDLIIRTRDIQLLRVTKQMQMHVRGGDDHKQSSEIAALEKRAEYSQKAHSHKLDEKSRASAALERKIRKTTRENMLLDSKLQGLEESVSDRRTITDVQKKRHPSGVDGESPAELGSLKDIYARRRLMDLARSQAQDIAILRDEVERLRMRTFPAFPTKAW